MSDIHSGEHAVRSYLLFLDDPAKVVDAEAVHALELRVGEATDPIERLKLISQLAKLRHADGENLKLSFILHVKEWADGNGVTIEAFEEMGVGDDVLRAAGFRSKHGSVQAPARTRAIRRERAPSVGSDDIRGHVLQTTEDFTLADVARGIGGSPMTIRKVVETLIAEGRVQRLGVVTPWNSRGRAPYLYRRS